jgi:CheY-like chemotaxis protein
MEHEGAIDIHSVLGEGTTVTIYLPLTDAKMSEVAESEEDEVANNLESKRILVVDDNADLLDMVSSMLGHLGHSCVICSDPREAFELLEHEHPDLDLVITDYSMPNISGIEILDHCRDHYPSLPVILSTGFSSKIADQLDEGRSDIRIFNKPYNFRELKEALHQSF